MMLIKKFTFKGKERFHIVDAENPEIVINDAQGYGFKTYEKAQAFIECRKVAPRRESNESLSSAPLF